MVQKIDSRHQITEENENRDPESWKAAREAIDALGPDGMSGEETESEVSGQEKQRVGVPVQWVNHKLMEMCHAVDTWESTINDQSFSSPRGNRPLTRLPRSKKSDPGKPTKGLPQNWYDDTWFKSQPDSKKLLLNIAAF